MVGTVSLVVLMVLLQLSCVATASSRNGHFNTGTGFGSRSSSSSDPVANPDAIVYCDGHSRITIFSDISVRVEHGRPFEDRATLAFTNRKMADLPHFTVDNTTEWCNITVKPLLSSSFKSKSRRHTTGVRDDVVGNDSGGGGGDGDGSRPSLVVSYNKRALPGIDLLPLRAHQLTVSNSDGIMGTDQGAPAPGPLGGTIYSLSNYNGSQNTKAPFDKTDLTCPHVSTSDPMCQNGVLSTSGWSYFSDSSNNVFDTTTTTQKKKSRHTKSNQSQTEGNSNSNSNSNSNNNSNSNSSSGTTQDPWWGYSNHRKIDGLPPSKQHQDLYFFVYGNDYKAALSAFAKVSGSSPVPPRRYFGVWWSRWQRYNFADFQALVQTYESNGIPLDGINFDTEWHENGVYLDQYPGDNAYYSGWFDWDRSLYPSPGSMVDWFRNRNLWPAWFDIHEAAGVAPNNSAWPSFARATGANPDRELAQWTPVAINNRTFVEAFFSLLATQTGATNYWWLDNPYTLSNLTNDVFNNIFWDRIVFWRDTASREATTMRVRPTVMGPYSGFGTQRYPFGHSGDVITSWTSLQFQIGYTATAANVGWAYITHDLGGHRDNSLRDGNDPELYTRWLQYGAWNTMMRPHPQKAPNKGPDTEIERRIWEFGYKYFNPMRAAFRLHARLVPYLYSLALDSHVSGVPFLRHMYIDYPEEGTAVTTKSRRRQFLVGQNILVAPVCEKMDPALNTSLLDSGGDGDGRGLYLPGAHTNRVWVSLASGRCLRGGRVHAGLNYTLWETPVFAAAGSIIPMTREPDMPLDAWRAANASYYASIAATISASSRASSSTWDAIDDAHIAVASSMIAPPDLPPPLTGPASQIPATVVWEIYFGNATTGVGHLNEDDGVSSEYETIGATTTTRATYTLEDGDSSGNRLVLEIAPREGPGFSGAPTTRHHEFVLHNVLAPLSNSARVTQCGVGGSCHLSSMVWDASTLTARVTVYAVAAVTGVKLQLEWSTNSGPAQARLCSIKSSFTQMLERARRTKESVDLESKLGTEPSRALNLVAGGAGILQDMAENMTASKEFLDSYTERLHGAIALHLNAQEKWAPTPRLQSQMRAWFGL